jgi:hypothetical protein
MSQELTYETVEATSDEERGAASALTVCRECGHLVPKTMLCLWCGSPILFRMPRNRD